MEKSFDGIIVGGEVYRNRDTRFNPSPATSDMTQNVGLADDGKLKTKPGEGGQGGGNGFVVTFSTVGGNADKTFAEIKEAYDSDKTVKGIIKDSVYGDIIMRLSSISDYDIYFSPLQNFDIGILPQIHFRVYDNYIHWYNFRFLTNDNVVDEITSDTSDTKIPTVGAIRAYVAAMLGEVDTLIGSGEIT